MEKRKTEVGYGDAPHLKESPCGRREGDALSPELAVLLPLPGRQDAVQHLLRLIPPLPAHQEYYEYYEYITYLL